MLKSAVVIFSGLVSFSAFGQAGTVTGVVTNIDKAKMTFSITEPAPSNRATTYTVDNTFKMTLNGAPLNVMGPGATSTGMQLKDTCAVTVVTPPKAQSAACKR